MTSTNSSGQKNNASKTKISIHSYIQSQTINQPIIYIEVENIGR